MIKIKGYAEKELIYIKDNYGKLTVNQLSKNLNKTYNSVSNAVRKMGLKKQIHNSWTEKENEYLKNNYMNKTSYELSEKLGRSYNSINAQLDKLNLVRNKSWSEYEIEFLKNNFSKLTHKEIGNILNRTETAVRAKCFDLDLYKKEIPWEDWEIDYLKNNYMEMTNSDISKVLNRTENAIHLKASRFGMKKYPYTCDYHYFDNIDTEEKAYWLGFMTADGWINKSEKSNAGVVGIELQYGDIGHLKNFNKSISGNYKITDRWRECILSNSKKKKHMCCIRIFSITMYESLIKLGFSNNKSFDAFIPNKISDNLMRHYIRGYFDGNGCFTYTKKAFKISFSTASVCLKNDIISCLQKQNIEIKDYSYITEYGTLMYNPSICKKNDKIKFLDYIYKDANIYLDRKYEKYLQVKEETN